MMDFRLEGVVPDILVEKSVDRDSTAARKLNKNLSPATYDSPMGLGLCGGRTQRTYTTQTPIIVATKYL